MKANQGPDSEPVSRKAVGLAIRARRKSLSMTQEELATRIRKSVPTVSKIESGQHPLDLDTLSVIAASLETTPTRILWECEKDQLSKDAGTQKLIPILDVLLEGLERNGVRL